MQEMSLALVMNTPKKLPDSKNKKEPSQAQEAWRIFHLKKMNYEKQNLSH